MSDMWQSTALAEAGLRPDGPGAAAVALRRTVLEMTQTAEEAVLAPKACGAWSADFRAALAARLARLNNAPTLAARYEARQHGQGFAWIADPSKDAADDPQIATVLRVMDQVATAPKDIAAADIAALQEAGVADDDIVRLCELNAFLAYQFRLIAGLRLIAERGQ